MLQDAKVRQWFPNQIEYHKKVPFFDAYPSGRIATATTTLIVIAENYPELKWIKPVGYFLLAGISTALVSTNLHWWSDIPLGIALGYSFGMIAAHPEGISFCNNDDSESRVQIFPVISPYGGGVTFSYEF
ncbi:MAG: phosphatase PAP2 family protein [bacterium]